MLGGRPWKPFFISYGLRPLPPAPDLRILGLQILGIVAGGSWHFLVHQLVSFASLFFWDTGEHNKENFDEVQAWISIDFWWILWPMGVIWHAWCFYFGVLGEPGTILGRSWDIGGH